MRTTKTALPDSPVRSSVRLPGYDYSAGGVYFVTTCTLDRACRFGAVVDAEMRLNDVGAIVDDCWRSIAAHHVGVELDAYVVMPNHVHGILRLACVGATHASPALRPLDSGGTPTTMRARGAPRRSIGSIVGTFKAAASRRINEHLASPGGAIWQRNYYEHVIRNDPSLERIRQYIAANPARWPVDPANPRRGDVRTNTDEPWCV